MNPPQVGCDGCAGILSDAERAPGKHGDAGLGAGDRVVDDERKAIEGVPVHEPAAAVS